MIYLGVSIISFWLIYRYLTKERVDDTVITEADRKEQDRLLKLCEDRFQERVDAANLDRVLRENDINMEQ